ncbi:hypothetical protein BGZ65_004562, partial [Modicella reniformis]
NAETADSIHLDEKEYEIPPGRDRQDGHASLSSGESVGYIHLDEEEYKIPPDRDRQDGHACLSRGEPAASIHLDEEGYEILQAGIVKMDTLPS